MHKRGEQSPPHLVADKERKKYNCFGQFVFLFQNTVQYTEWLPVDQTKFMIAAHHIRMISSEIHKRVLKYIKKNGCYNNNILY